MRTKTVSTRKRRSAKPSARLPPRARSASAQTGSIVGIKLLNSICSIASGNAKDASTSQQKPAKRAAFERKDGGTGSSAVETENGDVAMSDGSASESQQQQQQSATGAASAGSSDSDDDEELPAGVELVEYPV